MDFIRVPFGYVLEFFYGFLNNYGLALILFSFVVKLILLPFSARARRACEDVRLQPQLKQLELACGDDKQKYQQEVMALYKSEGVSMYGGCLWSFLPLLFLLPLYTVIREPLHYLMHLNTETVDALKAIVATEQGVEVSKLGYYWQYGPGCRSAEICPAAHRRHHARSRHGRLVHQFFLPRHQPRPDPELEGLAGQGLERYRRLYRPAALRRPELSVDVHQPEDERLRYLQRQRRKGRRQFSSCILLFLF